MQKGINIQEIEDEDLLRRMWTEAGDSDPLKKEIRLRMYKLREQRLKTLYNREGILENILKTSDEPLEEVKKAQSPQPAETNSQIPSSKKPSFSTASKIRKSKNHPQNCCERLPHEIKTTAANTTQAKLKPNGVQNLKPAKQPNAIKAEPEKQRAALPPPPPPKPKRNAAKQDRTLSDLKTPNVQRSTKVEKPAKLPANASRTLNKEISSANNSTSKSVPRFMAPTKSREYSAAPNPNIKSLSPSSPVLNAKNPVPVLKSSSSRDRVHRNRQPDNQPIKPLKTSVLKHDPQKITAESEIVKNTSKKFTSGSKVPKPIATTPNATRNKTALKLEVNSPRSFKNCMLDKAPEDLLDMHSLDLLDSYLEQLSPKTHDNSDPFRKPISISQKQKSPSPRPIVKQSNQDKDAKFQNRDAKNQRKEDKVPDSRRDVQETGEEPIVTRTVYKYNCDDKVDGDAVTQPRRMSKELSPPKLAAISRRSRSRNSSSSSRASSHSGRESDEDKLESSAWKLTRTSRLQSTGIVRNAKRLFEQKAFNDDSAKHSAHLQPFSCLTNVQKNTAKFEAKARGDKWPNLSTEKLPTVHSLNAMVESLPLVRPSESIQTPQFLNPIPSSACFRTETQIFEKKLTAKKRHEISTTTRKKSSDHTEMYNPSDHHLPDVLLHHTVQKSKNPDSNSAYESKQNRVNSTSSRTKYAGSRSLERVSSIDRKVGTSKIPNPSNSNNQSNSPKHLAVRRRTISPGRANPVMNPVENKVSTVEEFLATEENHDLNIPAFSSLSAASEKEDVASHTLNRRKIPKLKANLQEFVVGHVTLATEPCEKLFKNYGRGPIDENFKTNSNPNCTDMEIFEKQNKLTDSNGNIIHPYSAKAPEFELVPLASCEIASPKLTAESWDNSHAVAMEDSEATDKKFELNENEDIQNLNVCEEAEGITALDEIDVLMLNYPESSVDGDEADDNKVDGVKRDE